MTKKELIEALAPFADDREVVLDVDSELCDSDRNVLTIDAVKDCHPDLNYVFLNAGKAV